MGSNKKLTAKQQKFVEHYAACGNATEAARLAGYKKPNPQGAENLAKPNVKAALQALTAPISHARIATAVERQSFWSGIMRGVDIYKNVGADDPVPDVEMKERIKASELLGKAQQDFVTKVDVSGDGFTLVLNMSGTPTP